MPQIVLAKKNRTPQWVAISVAGLLLVGLAGVMIWLKVADAQQKAFDTAKNTAVTLDKRADYKKEAETLQKYLDSHPPKKYADQLLVTTATAYLNAKNYDKAIEYYTKADKVNSKNHGKALNGMALAYGYKGEKDKAIGYYKELLELTKQNKTPDMAFEIKSIEGEIKTLQEGTK